MTLKRIAIAFAAVVLFAIAAGLILVAADDPGTPSIKPPVTHSPSTPPLATPTVPPATPSTPPDTPGAGETTGGGSPSGPTAPGGGPTSGASGAPEDD